MVVCKLTLFAPLQFYSQHHLIYMHYYVFTYFLVHTLSPLYYFSFGIIMSNTFVYMCTVYII